MIKEAIAGLVEGRSMTVDEAAAAMEEIMNGEVTPAQFGAFVTALRLKGETVEEIAGLARTMRNHALKVETSGPVLDVVGTGGDGQNTFNISTAAAFVAAASGLKVAKHGNRAASSNCGAADVLEALGVKLDLTPEQVSRCVDEAGIGFMFAPSFHPAMKYAGPPRREIGIRTVFNILGPLTNPAGAGHYLLGVADEALADKMALVLKSLGCTHALVVHGEDGLDEVTVTGETRVCEMQRGAVTHYSISPDSYGLEIAGKGALAGGNAEENADLLIKILSGVAHGPRRDAVAMNSAAALVAGDRVKTMEEGVKLAWGILDSGIARKKIEELVKLSQSFGEG